jgi:putative ABC transport system permease protein
VLKQAIYPGRGGFLPGLVLWNSYRVARELANIPIDMSVERAALVLGLSVAMCAVSGLASLGRVHGADPADLF